MFIQLKTQTELEGFEKAGMITADIMRILIDVSKCNVTTLELDQIAREACNNFKVKPVFLGYHGFPCAICTSINEELVHGLPSKRILQEGDLLKIDIGIDFDGFIGDMARTIVIGDRSDKTVQMINDCHTALIKGISKAEVGNDIGDIGEEISRIARKGGWQVVLQYGGHGIDRYKLHSDPFIENARLKQRMCLREGMIFAIEPMFVNGSNARTRIANDKWTVLTNGPSAHFEDTIVITNAGPKVLTKLGGIHE